MNSPLEIGNVTFFPLDTYRPEFEGKIATSFREGESSDNSCLSCSHVCAEWRRASEIHGQHTQYALNILRFFGSLVWYDQPTRHIYIASQDPKRLSTSIGITATGQVSRVSTSDFPPIPFKIDDEFLEYAEFYGLSYVQSLLHIESSSELEQSFLVALQWYGEATQELLPLTAFIKYYISIEAAFKKASENAMRVLPKRLGVLFEPWDKTRYLKLRTDLRDLVVERNAVFHSGKPLNATPEELAWEGRILARQALHQLRLVIKSHKLQTKDDLKTWVDKQISTYLR